MAEDNGGIYNPDLQPANTCTRGRFAREADHPQIGSKTDNHFRPSCYRPTGCERCKALAGGEPDSRRGLITVLASA
jgi:hypothetical protein